MGIFQRMKGVLRSGANAAVDRMEDPGKQLDAAIAELDEQHRGALRELRDLKATIKQTEQQIAALQERLASWEQRAMTAVRAGDDALARQCLREKAQVQGELGRAQRDREEALSCAVQLNRARKEVDTRLRALKLRRGTLAAQIAVARSGGAGSALASQELFDRMDEAAERIDREAIAAEVDASLADAGPDRPAVPGAAASEIDDSADDALEALKARLEKSRR
jgi:phage shock protein A